MAQLRVTSESPVKIILETDPEWKAEFSQSYAGSVRQGRGCLAGVVVAFLLMLMIVWYSNSTGSLGTLPWSFWLFAGLLVIGGVIFILFEIYFESSHKNEADEVTVTIDLESQRAVRVEKLNSGKTKQTELRLEQVSQVLVLGDDAIHTLMLTFESETDPPFEVNSDVFFYSQPLIDLGKKLGAFIQKPVVFRITEAGKFISEESVPI